MSEMTKDLSSFLKKICLCVVRMWKHEINCNWTSSLTSWESNVTRSPSLAIPSSLSSLRCGHRAKQKARAIRSVSRLCSAESLASPLGWSPLCRKNTWHKTLTNKCTKGGGGQDQVDLSSYDMDLYTYFCPANDLSIFFVLWLLEHLGAADGLHGFPINGAYNSLGGRTVI